MTSPITAAPDSLTTTAAPNQAALKRHWFNAAHDCAFPEAKLQELCEALNNRGIANKSRLEYVLRGEGLFTEHHGRVTTLTRLLLEYNTRRTGSQVAQDKWAQARRGLLALREKLNPSLRDLPVFGKLEATPPTRPRRSGEVSWRER